MQNNTELEKDANVVDDTDYIEAIKTLKENFVLTEKLPNGYKEIKNTKSIL